MTEWKICKSCTVLDGCPCEESSFVCAQVKREAEAKLAAAENFNLGLTDEVHRLAAETEARARQSAALLIRAIDAEREVKRHERR